MSNLIHLIAWKDKVFDRQRGEVRNEILPVGLKAIRAKNRYFASIARLS